MAPNDNQLAFNDEEVTTQTELYTVFPKWEKVYIVSLITFAAWFSTLSSFIYYPVITFVARDLYTTVANVNLTVTAYMVVSGIAPALIGDLADQAGRRLTYVIALTARNIVGNGSIVPSPLYRLPIMDIMGNSQVRTDDPNSEVAHKSGWHVPNPMACLKVLSRKDTFIVVTAGGIIYMAYSCMQASLSTLCIKTYGLRQLEAGLIYLPFGFGSVAMTCVSGRILDRDYHITAKSHNLPVDKVRGDNLLTFPVEKARLRSAWVPIAIAAVTFMGYGWSLHFHAVRPPFQVLPLLFPPTAPSL
ncbi:MAG: hypothetical protein Q9171_002756 [Xanthocarpia ochracea]